MESKVRTIAIVAHVDHGKTTLLDEILKQSGTLEARADIGERMMDSNPQEKERGITILAKCTAIDWEGNRIQIVDTPGHQDFGGEVERVLRMVDSVLLLVDAVDGPMPQTRYVLRKALERGLKPIVVINKMDRDGRRPDFVLDSVFDLFSSLGANDEQLEFPVVYAAGRSGWASHDESEGKDLKPLFETIMKEVTPPLSEADKPLQFQVATLDYSSFTGRIAIGRIERGTVKVGDAVVHCKRDGAQVNCKVTKLMGFLGLQRVDVEQASAGEIVCLAGIEGITIGETICDAANPEPLPMIPIDQPTITMRLAINSSPFVGQDGDFVTSRQILERLNKELEHNVGLGLDRGTDADTWRLKGRGMLHLSVLIETMRREGFELSVGQPEVIMKGDEEPFEDASVTVPDACSGVVIQKLQRRGAMLSKHEVSEDGIATLAFQIPSRGLIGYRSEFLTDTRGEGELYHSFSHYGKVSGKIQKRENGAMIVQENCETAGYALNMLQERGKLICTAGEKVYAGQIIGLHSRANDLVVNPGKAKKLTNHRASGKDDAIRLTPPIEITLESALELIAADEFVEVTPKSIRLRKIYLDHNERKRSEKGK